MSLLTLPNELLLHLTTTLSIPDLNALARTNRRLANLLQPALIRKLIQAGSREYSKRALFAFGERGDALTVAWLLERGVLEVAGGQAEVFGEALRRGYEDVVVTLLDAGVDPEVRDEYARTLLMRAAEYGRLKVVRRLLAGGGGVDVNARNSAQFTALQMALQYSQSEIAMELLADPRVEINKPRRDVPEEQGEEQEEEEEEEEDGPLPPLELAMSNNLIDVVQTMIQDPRIDIPPFDGEATWLHWASIYGHKDLFNLILHDPRVNPNARESGVTAYMHAVIYGRSRWPIYFLLQDERVDRSLGPDNPHNPARHPIHLAAMNGWTDVMRILLAEEAVDVNYKYKGEETPLHTAIRFLQMEIVRMLVDDPRVDMNACYRDEPPLALAAEQLDLAAGSISASHEIMLLLLTREDVDLGILNRGVPHWDPRGHRMVLGDVLGHAKSGRGSRNGYEVVVPRSGMASVMGQVLAERRRGLGESAQSGDDW
ncbi:ankyrin [Choiromyces venosus 120613-1]|uniref:Ankyrin n=1 Tax=Choiromyces venosus 120613-1 TaxID=1336337 RepID=A0A3N4K0R0_9PEZI|nr:ankyrin [Choiromyces venosus 120613-1]